MNEPMNNDPTRIVGVGDIPPEALVALVSKVGELAKKYGMKAVYLANAQANAEEMCKGIVDPRSDEAARARCVASLLDGFHNLTCFAHDHAGITHETVVTCMKAIQGVTETVKLGLMDAEATPDHSSANAAAEAMRKMTGGTATVTPPPAPEVPPPATA